MLFALPTLLFLAALMAAPKRRPGTAVTRTNTFPFHHVVWPSVAMIAVYYSFVLKHQQHWYFNAIVLLLTLPGAALIDSMLGTLDPDRQRTAARRAVMVGIALYALIGAAMWERYLYPLNRYGQVHKLAVAHWIAERHDRFEGLRFGASDSGVLGYYCQCAMTNLDGVVNHDVYRDFATQGLQPETLARYVVNDGIDLLTLPDSILLDHWRSAGLELIEPIETTLAHVIRVREYRKREWTGTIAAEPARRLIPSTIAFT